MKKRILSVLLLGAMLLSLAACGGADTEGADTTADTTVADTVAADLPAGIEKKNYDREFTILYPNHGTYPHYYFVEENTGEAMDVALFNREIKIEEHLGIDIKFVEANYNGDRTIAAIPRCVEQMALSGDDLYQLILTHCISGNAPMLLNGHILDLNTINTINFDADWWNQTANENLEVAGRQYFATSDFMIPEPTVVVFNKGMVERLGLENPYDLVYNGEWTVDKMMEMMSAATLDDGDGVWDKKDTYGFATPDDWFLAGFTYSLGEQLTRKDENGELYFAFNTERAYTVYEKLDALLNSDDTFIYSARYADRASYAPTMIIDIASDRCLFSLTTLNNLELFRDISVDFGLLPYPKLDTAQEDYIALDWAGFMAVPSGTTDPDMVGEVMELLSYYGSEDVIPAYCDILLDGKLVRDPESRTMLNMIFDGLVIDAGMSYFALEAYPEPIRVLWQLPYLISKGETSGFASVLATYEEGAIYKIENFNKTVAEMD